MEYTKKQIEKLVQQTSSFNEFIRTLYGKTDGNSRRKGKRLVESFNINTSHYKVPKYTKEILKPVVESNNTMRSVCKELGLKLGGGSQAFISRKIKEFEIDCSHFKKQNFPRKKSKTWQEVLVKRDKGQRTDPKLLRRCLIESGRPFKCEIENCLVSEEWLRKPIILQVHHIDGDCLNNKPENLMLLCPNCHTQTSNWCSKGRNR